MMEKNLDLTCKITDIVKNLVHCAQSILPHFEVDLRWLLLAVQNDAVLSCLSSSLILLVVLLHLPWLIVSKIKWVGGVVIDKVDSHENQRSQFH